MQSDTGYSLSSRESPRRDVARVVALSGREFLSIVAGCALYCNDFIVTIALPGAFVTDKSKWQSDLNGRQDDGEGRAFAQLALHLNLAFHAFHHVPDDG